MKGNLIYTSVIFLVIIVATFASARAISLDSAEVISNTILKKDPILNIKVFLEGAMDGTDSMQTKLRDATAEGSIQGAGVLPKTDPYLGQVTIEGDLPEEMVDWVLVELYDSRSGELVKQIPAILMSDGLIKNTDGENGLRLSNRELRNNYYIVVRHRNHLAVCSSYTISVRGNSINYDFTKGNAYENRVGQKEISTGVYAMIAGDGDGNEYVQTNDKASIWAKEVGKYGYLQSDFNMDAYSQTTDKSSIWNPNVGKASQVNYLSDISAAFQANTHLITLESSSLPKSTNKINPFLRK